MSLSDYVRYLRALKGGPTPWQIEEVTGIPSGTYRQIEQRYRAVGEDDTLERLANYYQVPLADLIWRYPWSRKALNAALAFAQDNQVPVSLELRNGDIVEGRLAWWDLGALAVTGTDGALVVVQRHIIDRWQVPGVEAPAGPKEAR